MIYQPRTYRNHTSSEDLVSFKVVVRETDLFISAKEDLSKEAGYSLRAARAHLESYIHNNPGFQKALSPIDIREDAPDIIRDMGESSKKFDVGPMAAVAGAVAEFVGKELLKFSDQVIVENGGDIFLSSKIRRVIGLYAGDSKFSGNMAIEILPQDTPCGICTSSGTVGHSLSFGQADAVVIISRSATLADAAATAICNRVHTAADIKDAIDYAKSVQGLEGILIIISDTFGAWGNVRFVEK